MYAKNQLSKEADSGKLQFDVFLAETAKQNQEGFLSFNIKLQRLVKFYDKFKNLKILILFRLRKFFVESNDFYICIIVRPKSSQA